MQISEVVDQLSNNNASWKTSFAERKLNVLMVSEEVEREGYKPSVRVSFYNKEKRIELENQNNTKEPDTKTDAQANPKQADSESDLQAYSEADPEAYSEADPEADSEADSEADTQVGEQDEDHLEQEESDEAEPRSDLSINHHPLHKSN
ncbi:hypothetical protein G6F42_010717 [Rhizopus arrhizus]|nr:hypothetical protein G6F42_010717 [Rhizopus arrhizus]